MLFWPQNNIHKEADMKEFTITEDFPKSEIEFDMRFLVTSQKVRANEK
jgi:hypothetical protein